MRDSNASSGNRSSRLTRLPVGIESFPAICTRHYYYVDKTLLIRDVIDRIGQAMLFARPPKFGKTLNMSMLRTFFEDTGEDTWEYFADKAIAQCGEQYVDRHASYPVICLDFKDVAKHTWDGTLASIGYMLQLEYERQASRMDMRMLDPVSRQRLEGILRGKDMDLRSFEYALSDLEDIVNRYYDIPPVVLVDEYDAVVQEAARCGYGDSASDFMRTFLAAAIGNDMHWEVICLFGTQRPEQPLRDLKVHDALSDEMGGYFGFTSDEVATMAQYYDCPHGMTEIEEWYEGYRFGSREFYNPLSVLDYFQHGCIPNDYWARACANGLISRVLGFGNRQVAEAIVRALQGAAIRVRLAPNGVYLQTADSLSDACSLLYANGYLTTGKSRDNAPDGSAELVIPDKEVRGVFVKEMMGSLDKRLRTSYRVLERAMRRNRMDDLREAFRTVLQESLQVQDPERGDAYQSLITGLAATLHEDYVLTSACNEDCEQYSISLHPKWEGVPGVLVEAQKAHGSVTSAGTLAQEALDRIARAGGEAVLRKRGVRLVFKFGIGIGRDNMHVAVRETEFED